MAKPKPRTTPASRQRTAQRAEARQVMRESAARTGTKARLASGVKPGTKVATKKLPAIKNTAKPSKPVGTGGGGLSKPVGGTPRGPQLPKLPTTTKTVRATGPGGAGKIPRLASQAAPGSPAPRVDRTAARLANRAAKGYGKPIGSGTLRALSRSGAVRGLVGRAAVPLAIASTIAGMKESADRGKALRERMTKQQAAKAGSNTKFPKARQAAINRAKAIKGSPSVGPATGKTSAEQFDSAFKAARKAGVKTFTWKGKQYTTKKRGE